MPLPHLRHPRLEPVLAALAAHPVRDRVRLRGGVVTAALVHPAPRVPDDVDLLAVGAPLDAVADEVADALASLGPVAREPLWPGTAFPGVRFVVGGVQVDLGFGDPVAGTVRLHGLLAADRVTHVAWKLHGLWEREGAWRPKDLHDLWLLLQAPVDPDALRAAIVAAFHLAGTRRCRSRAGCSTAGWGRSPDSRRSWRRHLADHPERPTPSREPAVVAERVAEGPAPRAGAARRGRAASVPRARRRARRGPRPDRGDPGLPRARVGRSRGVHLRGRAGLPRPRARGDLGRAQAPAGAARAARARVRRRRPGGGAQAPQVLRVRPAAAPARGPGRRGREARRLARRRPADPVGAAARDAAGAVVARGRRCDARGRRAGGRRRVGRRGVHAAVRVVHPGPPDRARSRSARAVPRGAAAPGDGRVRPAGRRRRPRAARRGCRRRAGSGGWSRRRSSRRWPGGATARA
jgi:hypothetical protein